MAGDFIFLAHHAGGFEADDIVHQMHACFAAMERTLASVGVGLDDMVQINLYLRNMEDFRRAREVFFEHFDGQFPARMTTTTEFLDAACLCMMDGIAYRKGSSVG